MVIIFFSAEDNKIWICTQHEKTHVLDVGDSDIMKYVPNDDILYVQSANFMTKKQFGEWLEGDMVFDEGEEKEPNRFTGLFEESPESQGHRKQRLFIHPAHNGCIVISDLKTPTEPDGLVLNGKWDFRLIDDIGQDNLDESQFYQHMLAKGKIEVVDELYVKKNIHKKKKKISPAEQALNAILIPAHIKAEVAADGGYQSGGGGGAIEIMVE